jgi:predicted amidohydrolase YtcJ
VLDLLLQNARVLTQDARRPVARTIGVLHGRIVGLDEEVSGLEAACVADAQGAVVVPGFGDAHNHMVWYGLSLAEVDLSSCRSLKDIYEAVARRAQLLGTSEWVIGSRYDDVKLGGHPDREALDRAAGGRPVWLKHRSGHQCAVSSVVLERAGVFDHRPVLSTPGGVVTDRRGRPTGVLQENAQKLVSDVHGAYGVDDMAAAIARASQVYAAEGLTHVVECGIGGGLVGHSPVEALAYQVALDQGDLDVRVELMPSVDVLHEQRGVAEGWRGVGIDLGLRSGFGNDRLRLGPVKIWLDGSLVGRTAAVAEPYCDHGRGSGYLTGDRDEMKDKLLQAHHAGWRIAAHAIGDSAIDLALDVIEEAQRRHPRPDARHRIEHAAVVRPDQLSRMAAAGVIPVPQPRFLYEMGDTMADALGEARIDMLYRHRSFIQHGLRVPGSSDRPVVNGAPLAGMQSMVQRLTSTGRILGLAERVDAATALRAYTLDEAWASCDEEMRGHLGRGMLADLVILDDDPTAVAPEAIGQIGVLCTILGGRLTYGEDRFEALVRAGAPSTTYAAQ